jgi:hypothetical protein
MTTPDRALRRGVFLGGVMVFGAGIAGEALHWFITRSLHPSAPSMRHIVVAIEGVLGVAILVWGLATMRRETRALRLAASMKEASRDIPQ